MGRVEGRNDAPQPIMARVKFEAIFIVIDGVDVGTERVARTKTGYTDLLSVAVEILARFTFRLRFQIDLS